MFIEKITNHKFFRVVKHHWLTIAFILGFLTDLLLLNRVDDAIDNAILFFYFSLATVSMWLFYVGTADKASPKLSNFLRSYMPPAMQYSFGGLLSGMLIFYGRSGDWLVSAPFLILILAIIFANELIKKRSDRLLYNLVVYFTAIFSYAVLVVPVLIGEMGDIIFLGSGLLALLVVFLFIKVLSLIIPNYLLLEKKNIVFSIASLYVLFNTLYFLNLIPPIPLSLTELSIYQQVERTSVGGYRIVKEDKPWYRSIPFTTETFRPLSGQGAYCFARVYAPTSLSTTIVHRWEYYDEVKGWTTQFTFPYGISGENKNGYRGFTHSTNIRDGRWRCGVETERGQVLGRQQFIVDTKKQPSDVVTVVE